MSAKLSVVIPAFNEEENLPEIVRRIQALRPVLGGRGFAIEIVIIDDHSTDSTPEVAKELVAAHANISYQRLARNCGSHVARAAGLEAATGDAAVIMAADLQDPPEMISDLVDAWRQGNDVVWAVRSAREAESRTTLLTSWLFNSLMRHAFRDLPRKGADFLLVSRRVMDAFNATQEKNTNFNLAIRWLGFRQTSIEYVKRARYAGKTGFTLAKKVKVCIDSLVSYSYAPLRLISVLGCVLFLAGLVCAAATVVGWASGVFASIWMGTLVSVLLAGQGITLLTLGILGEYVWRVLEEVRHRPRYLIEDSAAPAAPEPKRANEPVVARRRRKDERMIIPWGNGKPISSRFKSRRL